MAESDSRMGAGRGYASIFAAIMEKTAPEKYPSAISMGRQFGSSTVPSEA